MTQKEHKAYLKEVKTYLNTIVKSEQESREFLVNAGILTTKGNLKQAYTSSKTKASDKK